MNKTAKVISVILAVVMALTVLPFAAFAAEEDNDRVSAWKENYGLLLEEVFDNENFASWKYADDNMKHINDSTAALTAFGLRDKAWVKFVENGGSTADPANAKKALLALLEKADYKINDGYVDEIAKIIDTAEDVNDIIQKVNAYLKIDMFQSEGWGKTFEVIGKIGNLINKYQDYRDKFVEAYTEILTVQMANLYYVDMLEYIVAKNSYAPLTQAASEMIDEIQAGVAEALEELFAQIAEEAADEGINALVEAAADTNVYTAAALKIYQVGTTAVNFLWNASNLYPLFDTIRTAYYYQADIAEWAKAAVNGDDAEKAYAALSFAITARDFSEEALYKLKSAQQDDSVVGKVQKKLYGTVYNDIEVSRATLDVMRKLFYVKADNFDGMKEIKRVITIYCPVNVNIMAKDNSNKVLYTVKDGVAEQKMNDYGVFVSVYSDYADTYHKVIFLYDTYRVQLIGTDAGYVTLIMDALKNGKIDDWSFTDRKISKDGLIAFETEYTKVPVYTASEGTGVNNFNDNFVPSEQPEVTARDVIDATAQVGKDEAKSFIDKIMDFFRNLFDKIFKIFKK